MKTVQPIFVEVMPDILEEGILYISIPYCIAMHKCVCGCGNEVVTPLSPTDWELTFNGKAVSLNPSIGNWSFKCQSHYWIAENRIRFARQWSADEIEYGRKRDSKNKKRYFRK